MHTMITKPGWLAVTLEKRLYQETYPRTVRYAVWVWDVIPAHSRGTGTMTQFASEALVMRDIRVNGHVTPKLNHLWAKTDALIAELDSDQWPNITRYPLT